MDPVATIVTIGAVIGAIAGTCGALKEPVSVAAARFQAHRKAMQEGQRAILDVPIIRKELGDLRLERRKALDAHEAKDAERFEAMDEKLDRIERLAETSAKDMERIWDFLQAWGPRR